ncbi:response regulator [Geomesophilobacter sediminis]|uniref:Response regulator n=1 Tax=Geomesophilobacter sediminis TaxID=2798584 RepID=A0A8J7M2C5_9BACT|nr:HD domain-containing phosphohydrolase [Geomesophilobacter sediminis]MBJ6727367.1 response regulator [Geomesophilobacter sediminis]
MNSSVKILIVDDEQLNREILTIMLHELGEIVTAKDGAEALTLLQETPDVDLVLLDLQMPVLDGFQTLDFLKKHPELREVPVIVITASKSEITHTLSLGANDFLAKPFDREELRLRAMNQVRTKKLYDMAKNLNGILEAEVLQKTAALRETLALAQDAEFEISLRLGRAAEFRDLETGMHTRRISEMSAELGKLAGLGGGDCELLRRASPLHDVGKVGIPDRILNKPGPLTDEEMEVMRQHTVIGGRILGDAARFPSLEAGQLIAMQHHEKWDGTGYPHRLAGNDIHLFSRIVAVVDVFDALASERPYKRAFPLDQVVSIMQEQRGTAFDPGLLDLFLDHLADFVRIRADFRD